MNLKRNNWRKSLLSILLLMFLLGAISCVNLMCRDRLPSHAQIEIKRQIGCIQGQIKEVCSTIGEDEKERLIELLLTKIQSMFMKELKIYDIHEADVLFIMGHENEKMNNGCIDYHVQLDDSHVAFISFFFKNEVCLSFVSSGIAVQ